MCIINYNTASRSQFAKKMENSIWVNKRSLRSQGFFQSSFSFSNESGKKNSMWMKKTEHTVANLLFSWIHVNDETIVILGPIKTKTGNI